MDVDLITQSQCFKCDEAEAAATADTNTPVQVGAIQETNDLQAKYTLANIVID